MIEVVAAALIAPDRRILLQQRHADRQHGGLWEFPGGKLEAGETAASALVREIDEELGVVLAADDLVRLAKAEDPDTGIVITLYTCCRWAGEPQCLDAAAIGWFTLEEIARLALPPLDGPLASALEECLREG